MLPSRAGTNMRTLRLSFCVFFLAPALVLAFASSSSGETSHVTVHVDAGLVKAIRHYRVSTRHLQHVMGGPAAVLEPVRHASLKRTHTIWRRRAVAVRRRFAIGPPHRSAWLCLHRYEGSWRDDGAPYYGGLQMDIGFQQHYGRVLLRTKGTANHWTPLEQMWIAEKAYRAGRGFYPWPNTARYCGLI
jgi:hypothetical protein